eukprot:TRINITY_DN16962_c0_g1_i1.p1 TRINITY_DN16962_c0_g1~~TRINITY_DN16962_c0_g1_i1.p1  ORF type:complete len:955 (+),score=183.66 TRINITY_DN16962_c0_g1_i1:126-2867(+)
MTGRDRDRTSILYLLLPVFFCIVLTFPSPISASDVSYKSPKASQIDVTRGSHGNDVNTILKKDLKGTALSNAKYLKLLPSSQGYQGEFTVKFPKLDNEFLFRYELVVNFMAEGSDANGWTWEHWNNGGWTLLGNNGNQALGEWKKLKFEVDTTKRTVLIRISGPDGSTGRLDYYAVARETCPVDPKKQKGSLKNTCPWATLNVKPEDYTYEVAQAEDHRFKIWTSPVSNRIATGDKVPDAQSSKGIKIWSGRNEFEAFQLIFGKKSGNAKMSIPNFAGMPSNRQKIKLYRALYVDGVAEKLVPYTANTNIPLNTNQNTVMWAIVYVDKKATAGKYTTTITVDDVEIPLKLEVSDFKLPYEASYKTQLNINVASLIQSGDSESDVKRMLLEHRFTPKSVPWPTGFNPSITFDSSANPNRCEKFYDEPDESSCCALHLLAPKYIKGKGWSKSTGFSSAMLFQFESNSQTRPQSFCGETLNANEFGSTAYNNKWKTFLNELDDYIVENGYDKKGYYYVQNEPNTAAAWKLAAHLCTLTKAAAPHLRIAISEEPKPEICEDSDNPCGYDIWIAHIPAYEEEYAWDRERDHGEHVWFYSLDHDTIPHIQPVDHTQEGYNQRALPYISWAHRAKGWAYYDFGKFFIDQVPTITAELFREAFEDYEYFYKANKKMNPAPYEHYAVDVTVSALAQSATSWAQDHGRYIATKKELGRYIEGKTKTLPYAKLIVEGGEDFDDFEPIYMNFQGAPGLDNHGGGETRPDDSPLVVDGKTWTKVGWVEYSDSLGHGWTSVIDGTSYVKYDYWLYASYSELEKSVLYDNNGHEAVFVLDVPNGQYDVTISVGWPDRTYPNDPYQVSFEGIRVVDNYIADTTEKSIYKVTTPITVNDGQLTMVTGGVSSVTGSHAFTFLNYLMVEKAV